LHDRVIVKRVENETKPPLASSFPDSAAEKPIKARSWLLARAKE
jgi:co-chaperonin GroES (HSP10)